MTDEVLSARDNVELLLQAQVVLNAALAQAIAALPADQQTEFSAPDVEGFALSSFNRAGLVQVSIPSPGTAGALTTQPIPPGSFVSLNPQPIPPGRGGSHGIIFVGG